MGILASTLGICLAVCGFTPQEDVAREQVDLIEVNHFYDDQGRHVFDQMIFYDWSPKQARHMVCAWRLVKTAAQLPQRNWRDGSYEAVWHDGDVLRKVKAMTLRESWTQHDPELVEREFLAKEKRRDLAPPKLVKK